ncbi:MAG: hypothetical protein MJ217_02950 [Bacilli bacterium]|nr:hypothetical protein [Bacilli bacterium]
MFKELASYKNLNFDDKLTPFLDSWDKILKISNKGAFVLFAGLGLKDEETMSSNWKNYSISNKGKELRALTDLDYEPCVDILITKLSKIIGEHNISEIFITQSLYDMYAQYLMNIANLYCSKLIKEEFIEYKNGVTKSNTIPFTILALNLVNILKEDLPDF